MKHPPMHIDDLVEHWTILDEERDLIAGKRDATRLGFTILLKSARSTAGSRAAVQSCQTTWWSTWPSRSGFLPRSSASTSGPAPRSSTTAIRSARAWAFAPARPRTRRSWRCGRPGRSHTPSDGLNGSGRNCSSNCARNGSNRRRLVGSPGSWPRPCTTRRSPGRCGSPPGGGVLQRSELGHLLRQGR